EEHTRVRLDGPVTRYADERRVPVVATEHLVRAMPGLDDLHRPRDLLAQQEERYAVVAHHRLAHRGHGAVDAGQQPGRLDGDPVVVGPEVTGDQRGVLELVTRPPA